MRNGWLIFVFNVSFIPGFCQSSEKQIDSLMNAYYKPDQPGAVIAIEQNNKTLFRKGYGKSDLVSGSSITAEDNFNIGSLTKQFTAFAVLDLFYKGKFSRNDSIGKFLKLPHPVSSVGIFRRKRPDGEVSDTSQWNRFLKISACKINPKPQKQ